jgi:adenine-specific DNA methylase
MKSVKVIPQIAYANGKQVTFEAINVQSVYDDLFSHVTFRYILLDANNVHCGEGAYELKGERYGEWDASAESAYKIVIASLGLMISPMVGKSSIFEG